MQQKNNSRRIRICAVCFALLIMLIAAATYYLHAAEQNTAYLTMRRFSKCRHAASIQRKLSAPLRNPRLCLSERSTIFGAARVTPSVGMTAGANLPKSQAPAIPQAEQPSLTDWTAPDLCFGVICNWARTEPKRLKNRRRHMESVG